MMRASGEGEGGGAYFFFFNKYVLIIQIITGKNLINIRTIPECISGRS